MSSNFCIATLCCIASGAVFQAPCAAATGARFADVVKLPGGELAGFAGTAIDRLAMFACTGTACHTIPFQVDERDAAGRWVLDQGPLAAPDDPPGVLDAHDLLLFMATDAGDRAQQDALLKATSMNSHAGEDRQFANASGKQAPQISEITLRDPLDDTTRWAYLVAFADRAPRAPAAYVAYDPTSDRVRGQRVSLGFVDGVPGYLAVGDGANLLDRLKVRASATFLFGLIHFSRSEADLRTQFMGWHAGPRPAGIEFH